MAFEEFDLIRHSKLKKGHITFITEPGGAAD